MLKFKNKIEPRKLGSMRNMGIYGYGNMEVYRDKNIKIYAGTNEKKYELGIKDLAINR